MTPPKLGKLEPEFVPAFQQWKLDGSHTTMRSLLQSAAPAIDSALYSTAGRNPSANIKSRARILAARAVRNYDPERGTLKTHLLSQLQPLRRDLGQEEHVLKVPEQLLLERVSLYRVENELTDSLGRPPSVAELADRAGLSAKRIQKVRSYRPALPGGAMLSETGEQIDAAVSRPGDTTAEDAWADMVYEDLSPENRFIMDSTSGRHGHGVLETREIARHLQLSPGAISQRKAKIQEMLDRDNRGGL